MNISKCLRFFRWSKPLNWSRGQLLHRDSDQQSHEKFLNTKTAGPYLLLEHGS